MPIPSGLAKFTLLQTSVSILLTRIVGWLTTGYDIAGAVYGVIVATATISVIEDIHNTIAWEVIGEVLLAVLAFSLAEAYAEVIREHIHSRQGLRVSNFPQMWVKTIPALVGGSIVLVPFAYYAVNGLPLGLTDDPCGPYGMTDIGVPALMFILGLAIGRNAGESPGRCLLAGLGNTLIAGVVIAFKMGVH